jgi:Bacterial aa3 type cytochrome c oxidase subunit IV
MADNHDPSKQSPSGMDYSEHQKTYEMFNFILKWGVIGCIVILLLMLAFCTPS